MKFDFGRYGVQARAQPVATPAEIRSLPNNRGIEGLIFVPKGLPLAGTLIAFSERGLDRAGNILAFLIGGPTPGGFAVRRTDSFDISDCALLPSGDLLLLERRFSWASGASQSAELRRIALSSIAPGALVDGPILLFADLGYQIDNMEALGVHQTARGETVLTLLSGNFRSAAHAASAIHAARRIKSAGFPALFFIEAALRGTVLCGFRLDLIGRLQATPRSLRQGSLDQLHRFGVGDPPYGRDLARHTIERCLVELTLAVGLLGLGFDADRGRARLRRWRRDRPN